MSAKEFLEDFHIIQETAVEKHTHKEGREERVRGEETREERRGKGEGRRETRNDTTEPFRSVKATL